MCVLVRYLLFILSVKFIACVEENPHRHKVRIQRHYEKEDILIPAASGYLPQSNRGYHGFGTGGFGSGFGNIGFGSGMGFGSMGGMGGMGFGGGQESGYFNKGDYDKEDKKVNEQGYIKSQGSKGEGYKKGAEGYNEGIAAAKNMKADSGYYNDKGGAEKSHDDGKFYHGQKHFDEAGKKGEQNNEKKGFKKGYSTKGFKTSAHKDEEEKSETFYDEAHDEAEDAHFKGNVGSFGQKAGSKIKGGAESGSYNKVDKGEKGQYEKGHVMDASKGEKGQYGQKAYNDNGATYAVNNGLGMQSVLGHQEAAGAEKHYGHKTVPFYGGY